MFLDRESEYIIQEQTSIDYQDASETADTMRGS